MTGGGEREFANSSLLWKNETAGVFCRCADYSASKYLIFFVKHFSFIAEKDLRKMLYSNFSIYCKFQQNSAATTDPTNLIPILQALSSTSIGAKADVARGGLQDLQPIIDQLKAARTAADATPVIQTLASQLPVNVNGVFKLAASLVTGAPIELVLPLQRFSAALTLVGNSGVQLTNLLGSVLNALNPANIAQIEAAITALVTNYQQWAGNLNAAIALIGPISAGLASVLSVLTVILGTVLQIVVGLIGAIGAVIQALTGIVSAVATQALNALIPLLANIATFLRSVPDYLNGKTVLLGNFVVNLTTTIVGIVAVVLSLVGSLLTLVGTLVVGLLGIVGGLLGGPTNVVAQLGTTNTQLQHDVVTLLSGQLNSNTFLIFKLNANNALSTVGNILIELTGFVFGFNNHYAVGEAINNCADQHLHLNADRNSSHRKCRQSSRVERATIDGCHSGASAVRGCQPDSG